MRAYPQKQTIVILVICILAVGGVALHVFKPKTTQSAIVVIDPVVIPVATTSPILSSGDWRTQFQVFSASSTAFKVSSAQHGGAVDPQSNTATYKLGQSFLTQYILLRQNGLTGDTVSISSAMDKVIAETSSTIKVPKRYTIQDIRTVPDVSQNFHAYGASLMKVYTKYALRQDEAEVAAQAFENSDIASLSRIDPIIQNYKTMTAQLVAIPVPATLQPYHLDLINNMVILEFCASAFRNMDTDPYAAMAAITADGIATQDANSLFTGILAYLIEYGVKLTA